jgi:hypothetical protein
VLREQPDHRHQEARRAEAALQAVALVKRLLHRVQWSAGGGKSLDSRNLVSLGLDRQHQARPHRRAVKQDGAASAHPVLAPDVGPGEAEIVAKVIREQPAWIGWRRMGDAVHLHAAKAFSVIARTR